MNILIDILHPAHVHFFRNFIFKAKSRGHKVVVTTRNKEITNALLKRYGIDHIHVSDPAASSAAKLKELAQRWGKIFLLMKKLRIDAAMSIAGLCTSVPARILGIPNVTFNDTEDAAVTNRISYPFSDVVATPRYYLRDAGKNQVKYNGQHELAYLRDFDFSHLDANLAQWGLDGPYIVLRLVANDALHDKDITGIDISRLDPVISRLEKWGRVIITSQAPLPDKYRPYLNPAPIEAVFHVLAGALMFVGESPTMAVESGMLGTPGFLCSSRWKHLGYVVSMEKEHGLLTNFSTHHDLIQALDRIRDPGVLKDRHQKKAALFRENANDMTEIIEEMMRKALRKRKKPDAF